MIGLPRKACVVAISCGQWWLTALVRDHFFSFDDLLDKSISLFTKFK